ncbi:MAG TPA: FAD-dependent monooxygenase [Candidatus Dormibacteraeota bacterium]
MSERELPTEVSVLIAGAGPTGLSTAIGLGRLGVPALVVERRDAISTHPRATGVLTRSMEVLRQWGLEATVLNSATEIEAAASITPSLAGPEVARIPAYDPVEAAALSPSRMTVCPQDVLDPLLARAAAAAFPGTTVRTGVELVDLAQDEAGVAARLRDVATGAETLVRARYVVGADGGRSRVRDLVGVSMRGSHLLSRYRSTLFRARLGGLALPRPAVIYFLTAPSWTGGQRPPTRVLVTCGADRWVLGIELPGDGPVQVEEPSREAMVALIRQAVGDPTVDPDVLSVQTFPVAAEVADRYQVGRVLLAGDAAHRMPPSGAMGMNTGIQDAHNLAWKLAGAIQGWGGEDLVASYEEERRPVGELTVARAQDLGGPMLPLRAELGLIYASRIVDSEAAPAGDRLAHAWVTTGGARASTLDLLGPGFTLLTGPAGAGWSATAPRAGVPLTHRIAGGAEAALRIGRTGAVLVRPDGHVAWRCPELPADPRQALTRALLRAAGRAAGAGVRQPVA